MSSELWKMGYRTRGTAPHSTLARQVLSSPLVALDATVEARVPSMDPGWVGNWCGGPEDPPCLYPGFPPSCPARVIRDSVSNPRLLARSVRISRTTRGLGPRSPSERAARRQACGPLSMPKNASRRSSRRHERRVIGDRGQDDPGYRLNSITLRVPNRCPPEPRRIR
jgi:hypothetical protein